MKRNRLTNAIVDTLAQSPDGMSSGDLSACVSASLGSEFKPKSLPPTLSTMKACGLLTLEPARWKLDRRIHLQPKGAKP